MRYVPAFFLDAVLVLIFAAIGRASHDEDPGGFLITAWPFLVALVIGHALAALLPGRPRRPWALPWGAAVWVVTVVGGMLLRLATGDTAQVAFVIVATLVLGLFLVGWRALAALLRRRASTRAAASGTSADLDDRDLDGGDPAAGDAVAEQAAADAREGLRGMSDAIDEADAAGGTHTQEPRPSDHRSRGVDGDGRASDDAGGLDGAVGRPEGAAGADDDGRA